MKDPQSTRHALRPFTRVFRLSIVGGWIVAVTIVVAASVVMGANHSTTALFLALGTAPAILTLHLARNGPSVSVAEVLHSAESHDGRR
jgi:hypothetical protein